MKELLLSFGFKVKSSCSCGGTINITLKRSLTGESLVCKIKPNRGIWNLTRNGVLLGKGTARELNQKLKDYAII